MAANINDTNKELYQVCRDSKLFKKVLVCVEIQLVCRWLLLSLCAGIDPKNGIVDLSFFIILKCL